MSWPNVARAIPVASTILILILPDPSLAVVHGDAELLKNVALLHRGNFESILTLKGQAIEEMTSTQGDSYDYMISNRCTFVYDQVSGAVRWNKQTEKNHLLMDGKVGRDPDAGYSSAMVKDQTSYKYSALGRRDGKKTYHLVVGPQKFAARWGTSCLDPRYFMSDPAGGGDMHGRLMFLYEAANDPKLGEWHVTQVGNSVTLAAHFVKDGDNTVRYVFDLSKGGNLVEYLNKTPRGLNNRTYEYEQNNGLWIPKSYEWRNITSRDGEDLHTTRRINWTENIVNVPFEEDEFTLEKLGLKPGEDIHDHRVGIRYKYAIEGLDGAGLPEELLSSVESSTDEPDTTDTPEATAPAVENVGETKKPVQEVTPRPEPDEAPSMLYPILAGVVIVALVIGCVAHTRKRRKQE